MKKRIVFSAVCALIAFVVAFSVMCPNMQFKKSVIEGAPVYVSLPAQGQLVTPGVIEEDGTIIADKAKATVIEFDVDATDIKCMQINFANRCAKGFPVTIESSVDDSFIDMEAVFTSAWSGEDSLCVPLVPADYSAVRIWFEEDCTLKDISFYDTLPEEVVSKINIPFWRYALVIIIALGVFSAAFVLDKQFDLSEKLIRRVKKNYLRTIIFIIGSAVCVILGIVTELLFRALWSVDSWGNGFNSASCTVFCVIFVSVFALIFERKNLADNPERFVAIAIVAAGMLIIFSQPFGHNCWDMDSHYPWAVQNSFFDTAYLTEADMGIKDPSFFKTHPTFEDSETLKTTIDSIGEIAVVQENVEFSIAHLPSGILMAIARFFGVGFYGRYLCGQMASILVYASVCYFAIKRLKSGKMIASVIALFPTSIFLSVNFSYDCWVTAFSLLGTAYFVSELEQPDKPITVMETVIMCGAFAVAALPKQIYVMLLVIPLFMFKSTMDKQARKRYYIILAIIFAASMLLFLLRSTTVVESGGDTRGGAVNTLGQIKYILGAPFEYTKTLLSFLKTYLSVPNMREYTSYFAYRGHGELYMVFVALIGFTVLTDKGEGNKYRGSVIVRIIAILLLIGGSAVIASALYVAFTPVGSTQILGCQPRYIIPLLPPVLLTVANPRIKIIKNKAIYNAVVLVVLTATVIFEITKIIAVPMM